MALFRLNPMTERVWRIKEAAAQLAILFHLGGLT
jgi:hypothetical protein